MLVLMDVADEEEGSADVTAGRLMKMFQVCVHHTTHVMESPPRDYLSASLAYRGAAQSTVHCNITTSPFS